MWLGSNGVNNRWPPLWIIATIETIKRTDISKAKKKPATLVETYTPLIINITARIVRTTVNIPQGTFHLR